MQNYYSLTAIFLITSSCAILTEKSDRELSYKEIESNCNINSAQVDGDKILQVAVHGKKLAQDELLIAPPYKANSSGCILIPPEPTSPLIIKAKLDKESFGLRVEVKDLKKLPSGFNKTPLSLAKYTSDFDTWSRCEDHISPDQFMVILPEDENHQNLRYLDKYETSHQVIVNHRRCAKLPRVPGRLQNGSNTVLRIYSPTRIYKADKWDIPSDSGFLEICKKLGNSDPVVRIMSDKFKEKDCQKLIAKFQNSTKPGKFYDDFHKFNREFSGAGISDLSAFHGLNFTYLDLSGNQIASLKGLEEMESLKDLRVSNNPLIFSEFFPPNLEALFLNNTSLGSLKGLKLPYLQRLEINQMPDLKSLDGLEKLEMLSIVQAALNPGLQQCSQLFRSKTIKTVTGSGSICIAEEAAKHKSDTLEDLILDHCNIQEFSWITNFPALDQLSLKNNRVKKISAGAIHPLRSLDLKGNDLKTLDEIHRFSNLHHLDASLNRLDDIDGLKGQDHLEYLFLGQNELTQVDALAGIHSLKDVSLPQNKIRDIRPLADLKGLNTLNLEGNLIPDFRPLIGLSGLGSQLFNLVIAKNPVLPGQCPTDTGPEILKYRCQDFVEKNLTSEG